MAEFRVHPSAQPITAVPEQWWTKAARAGNPFLEQDMQQKLAASKQSEEEWLEDVKFGLAHINQMGEIIIKPNKYQLVLDMNEFQPEDITVRAVHNGIYVKAAHPDIVDGKEYIAHHFYREYVLPHDIDPNDAKSWMTPEHILFIEAPKVEFNPNLDEENQTVKEVKVEMQTE